MNKISQVLHWLSSLFVSPEDYYLSRSVDLADFERRQRMVEQARHRNLLTHMYY